MQWPPEQAVRAKADRLLELLDRLVEACLAHDRSPKDYNTGTPLHRAEIHTVQAIGLNPKISITRLAKHLGITKGAVSQVVTQLAAKRLVNKSHAPGSRKEVELELTELGWKGFHAHERFHAKVQELVSDYYGRRSGKSLDQAIASLRDLLAIVNRFVDRGGGA